MENRELQQRLCELIGECSSANLITIGPEGYPRGRLMADANVAEDWTLWYATFTSSRKVQEIASQPKVTLFYERKRDQAFACVMGEAEVCTDQQTKDEYWKEDWRTFWPQGPTDPDYCIIKVRPHFAELWDANAHKVHNVIF